jgi:U3 small nucleolar RNA-associated protein 23
MIFLVISHCCIAELSKMKEEGQKEIQLAKSFDRRLCGHKENPLSPAQCIADLTNKQGKGNIHRYVVATQDVDLRQQLRAVPGVPLIYIYRCVMTLEPVSHATQRHMAHGDMSNRGINEKEREMVKHLKKHGSIAVSSALQVDSNKEG